MNYEEMSDEELQRLLVETFSRAQFNEVIKDYRQTVIAILKVFQKMTRR
ncbi:MAG: hypothetical protein WCQ90_10975 [Deltaproteobacteria bacterium]